MKVHPLIQKRDWNKILGISRVSISSNEKKDRLFNWMRPAVSVIDWNTLQLHAFLGRDYVLHYASIVATHLALKDGNLSVGEFTYPTPQLCFSAFDKCNLAELGQMDIVVLSMSKVCNTGRKITGITQAKNTCSLGVPIK